MKKTASVKNKNKVGKLLKGLFTMTAALAVSSNSFANYQMPPPCGEPHVSLNGHSDTVVECVTDNQ